MNKIGYFVLAWTSLIIGIVGVILPLLPTTPFVLLAAFSFSKSSPRFHQWLLSHSVFGNMIQNWEKYGVITLRAKITATCSVIIMLTISFYFVDMNNTVKLIIAGIMFLVFSFIWSRPSQINKK
ncbi:MAG: uncharacterized membrane protein YbaN (DUF454 family) [Psychrosphaera sp.]|uniref:YbaN family protein n=1 Tax=Psychrosphaera sp. F3M07 TaxID=2841560 RepID=UPI001C08D91C|nr:YbaN family protein [Psychrosphaera sp. F3M07]MBU2919534.1 YbaN family protein [Psychrosphaera sp. F3M07]